ncbi:hypothetical protein M407DRAFT_4557 [Tulasnella calospora MUT 4182]|uniref:Uncharacterized protein n=1 Tax=Tulasnella calospora MUT 4182 TaxID=1051891 RepID=A0A0C3MF82_9AGAM|nr:hypothetical protein M407DRAFT_4557 [Tulasnella calospora MUT 4182]
MGDQTFGPRYFHHVSQRVRCQAKTRRGLHFVRVPVLVEVAHLLARNAHGNAELGELWRWSPQLAEFQKDNPESLVRQQLIQHEIQDFELRQLALADEFEYVPLEVPLYFQCHTTTPSYPHTFLFSSQDIDGYPLRHWYISIYAVLMASSQPLVSPGRIISAPSNAAQDDVNQLIRLYRRHITAPSLPITTISIQESQQIKDFLAAAQRMPPIWNTTTRVQESPARLLARWPNKGAPWTRPFMKEMIFRREESLRRGQHRIYRPTRVNQL